MLARFLASEAEAVAHLAEVIRGRKIDNVVIAARGSSDNAGRYAQYLLGAVNQLPVALTTPSLFSLYRRPPHFPPHTLILGISQSGSSPDIVSVLAEAQRQERLTAAITNNPGSDLAAVADHLIDLHAGEERSIAATKTYTGELTAIALLAGLLNGDPAWTDQVERVPDAVARTLALNHSVPSLAERYRYMQACVVIGRGYNYATAFEIALKLKELTYTIAEPYSSADFLHGPLALIEDGFPVFVVAPSGQLDAEFERFLAQLRQRNAEIVVISNSPPLLSAAHRQLLLVDDLPEWLSPVIAVLPGQLLALHLARARHYDPDHPRGLRKVTETH